MTAAQVVWHGTPAENFALLEALAHNCGCQRVPPSGALLSACGAHRMVAEDQRALDGLVWMHRQAERLLMQEWLR